MNVDNAYLVLYHRWVLDITTFFNGRQWLQIHLLMLISGGTATSGARWCMWRKMKRQQQATALVRATG